MTATDIYVSSGVTSSGLTIRHNSSLIVLSDGEAHAIHIVGGGQEVISAGGSASDTVVTSGAQLVTGTAVGTILRGDASQYVDSGGFAVSTTVVSGLEYITEGAEAENVRVYSGGELQQVGDYTSGVTLSGSDTYSYE